MFKVWSFHKIKIWSLIKTEFAFMVAKEEMAHMNKLNRLLFSLSVSGVMSNTVRTETFIRSLGKINCIKDELTSKDDCLEWMWAAVPVDEADSERCEQMTNFTSHYLLIIQSFAI